MKFSVLAAQPVPADATEVRIALRDGVELAADVYRAGPGPGPVLLIRLPYDKDGEYCFMPALARFAAGRGFTTVVQDVRGKFRSGGATEFGVHEVDDGFDTVDWIAAQPWCDGDVVMWGDSYYGMTQLAAAASGHPAIKAISPRLTGTRLGREVTFADGSRDVEATTRKGYFASWYVDRDAYEWEIDWTARPLRRPFDAFFAELGRRSANFDAEFGDAPSRFQGPAVEQLLAAPPVPMLFTVGLFDNCAPYSWYDLRHLLADARWRDLVHLRLEAIDHETIHVDDSPPVLPAPTPSVIEGMIGPGLAFFDAVLAGRRHEIPAVRYETCHGETRRSPVWPPSGAREVPLFLDRVDDRLVLAEQPGEPATASWHHDPARPVPSDSENPFARLASRRDLSDVAGRADVLTFSGPVAEEPVDHTGPARVEVLLETTVQATNLHTRLLDVEPDGTQLLVAKGQVHLPRVPADRPVRVELPAISYRLRAGHRWALQLMSSDFPEFVLEPGDGSDPWEAETFAPSDQTVQLGGRLVLTPEPMTAPEPVLTFAFEARVEVAESIRIGHGPQEEVWFTPITGGTVTGPRLTGEVLPYGGDWSTTRPDGTELDARYLLRADDGTVIDIHNRGFWKADPDVEARVVAGEQVGEEEYYYRTAPRFRTDAPAHAWLTTTVFVGMAREEDRKVCIRFFALA